MLALLDAHFEADMGTAANEWRTNEVMISRVWNQDLSWALEALDFFGAERCFIDHHRPQDRDTAFDLKLKAVHAAGSSIAVETHCNFHPLPTIRGWVVLVHRGDRLSIRLGTAIRDAWAGVLIDESIRVVEMPHASYTYSRLFHQLADRGCSFVLPELGNLRITKTRRLLESRGQTYRRLVEATALAIQEVLA